MNGARDWPVSAETTRLLDEARTTPETSARATVAADAEIDATILALFDEHGAALTRYAASFGLEAEAAQDVVQDVFLALFRHLQLRRPQDHLRGWLFRVTHNLARRHQRQRRRGRESSLDGLPVIAATTGDPEQQLAQAQRHARLSAALDTLPDRDRQCLLLRAEGLRYREISRILGCSLGGVAKSLARTFAHLARAGGE